MAATTAVAAEVEEVVVVETVADAATVVKMTIVAVDASTIVG